MHTNKQASKKTQTLIESYLGLRDQWKVRRRAREDDVEMNRIKVYCIHV
jgi:hypothetical protein